MLGPDTQAHLCARTGASISATSRRTAGDVVLPPRSAVGASATSMRSASTITCRCPTGATARTMPTHSGRTRPHDLDYLRGNDRRAARVSTGTMPATPTGAAQRAHADHRRRTASPGCAASRTSAAGGRTRTTTGSAASRAGSPTAWVPRAKPIWFTELGCRAVDKGPNQPNVFPDPKSAESGLPYFSAAGASDLRSSAFSRRISAIGIRRAE